jgi:hypothetical protein
VRDDEVIAAADEHGLAMVFTGSATFVTSPIGGTRDRSMRIVILGSGGREHALAWRCASEGHEVHVAPGSDGIAGDARATALALADHAAAWRWPAASAPTS